jgi:hypothetical protein
METLGFRSGARLLQLRFPPGRHQGRGQLGVTVLSVFFGRCCCSCSCCLSLLSMLRRLRGAF